jgi:pilus assembly protein CpaC
MFNGRVFKKTIGIAASLVGMLLICGIVQGAYAQETYIRASFLFPEREPIQIRVLTGQSCLVVFDEPIGRLAVSNMETAEAVLVAPNQLMINGKASGRARFTTWSKNVDKFIFLDVDVRANLDQIDSQVRALFPKEDIKLSQANGSVVLSGNTHPDTAKQIENVVQAAGFKTVNLMMQPVQSMLQVQLQLRVAEVSRTRLNELAASPVVQTQPGQGGYTNTGLGPWSLSSVDAGNMFGTVANTLNLFVMSNNAFMFLRALQTQGALRALAEPNLVAMNGQQANFLAGGEIPIPIVQGGATNGNTVTIQWKEYGVRVGFKPTILDEQHIRLEIEPEVSTLDYNNAIRFNGFLIPALRTRRAKTGIELQDGQSFGIAGLLDNNETKALSKIPVIGDVPILGNLFKSKSFQKAETELVFIVTAKLTKPMDPDSLPQMRGVDGLKSGSPLGVSESGTSGDGGASGNGDAPAGDNTPKPEAPKAVENPEAGGVKATESMPPAKSSLPAESAPEREPAASDREKPAEVDEKPKEKAKPAGEGATPDPAGEQPRPSLPSTKPSKTVTKEAFQDMTWKIRLAELPLFTAQKK